MPDGKSLMPTAHAAGAVTGATAKHDGTIVPLCRYMFLETGKSLFMTLAIASCRKRCGEAIWAS